MIISGWTRYPGMVKMLYANPARTGDVKGDAAASGGTGASAANGDIVEISAEARAAANSLQTAGAGDITTLKAKVDKLFKEVQSRGSFVTFDSSKGGQWLDVSSLSDDELARITNDKDHQFPQDFSDYAQGSLNQRLQVSLEPYEFAAQNGDRRGHTMTINRLWEKMSPATREALNWTPAMMQSSEGMLKGDTLLFGKFDESVVFDNLIAAARRGGLSFSLAHPSMT